MSHAIAKEETLKPVMVTAKPKTKKKPAVKSLVMLDPGHGGIDTGAIGRNGSQEKHVVLAIAKNVRAILRNHGIDARLTRQGYLYSAVMIGWKSPISTARIRLCPFMPMVYQPEKRGGRFRFARFQPRGQRHGEVFSRA